MQVSTPQKLKVVIMWDPRRIFLLEGKELGRSSNQKQPFEMMYKKALLQNFGILTG